MNPFGLPTITSMFYEAQRLFDAKYYGYVNSDILLEPAIFEVLRYCSSLVSEGRLARAVFFSLLAHR